VHLEGLLISKDPFMSSRFFLYALLYFVISQRNSIWRTFYRKVVNDNLSTLSSFSGIIKTLINIYPCCRRHKRCATLNGCRGCTCGGVAGGAGGGRALNGMLHLFALHSGASCHRDADMAAMGLGSACVPHLTSFCSLLFHLSLI